MEIIKDRKALGTAIAGLARNKIDDKIQQLLVSSLFHRMEHNDNTALAAVLDALPKGIRGNAVKSWMTEYCRVKANGKDKNGNNKLKNTSSFEEEEKEPILNEAMKMHWTGFKPEPAQEVYDAQKVVRATVSAIEKKAKMAEENDDPQTAELLRSAEALLAS